MLAPKVSRTSFVTGCSRASASRLVRSSICFSRLTSTTERVAPAFDSLSDNSLIDSATLRPRNYSRNFFISSSLSFAISPDSWKSVA